MSGPTGIQLNTATGGAILGVDEVVTLSTATEFQIVKIGVSDSGNTPVQVGPTNPLPVQVVGGTFTLGTVALAGTSAVTVQNFPAKQAVSVAGVDGTVNVVGIVPVTISGTLGTVNINNFPASQVVTLAGASGTVNVVGTVPVLVAGNSTFTLGTVAFTSNASVALTGTVPLPTNAAQETGGNLGTAALALTYLQQLVELTKQHNALMQVLILQIGQMSGQMPESTADLIDVPLN